MIQSALWWLGAVSDAPFARAPRRTAHTKLVVAAQDADELAAVAQDHQQLFCERRRGRTESRSDVVSATASDSSPPKAHVTRAERLASAQYMRCAQYTRRAVGQCACARVACARRGRVPSTSVEAARPRAVLSFFSPPSFSSIVRGARVLSSSSTSDAVPGKNDVVVAAMFKLNPNDMTSVVWTTIRRYEDETWRTKR